MPQDQPQQPPHQRREDPIERFFERHHHQHKDDKDRDQGHEESQQGQIRPQHKQSELDKLKDYLHKDEEMEEEGRTYGGLM